ncbi:unnamed protein product [Linum trigynum]|uniref:Uncharacterized protein n=1 Tax=Linum trigynum TaxID=586398 RepID=A0AAV2CCF3_9ROSI
MASTDSLCLLRRWTGRRVVQSLSVLSLTGGLEPRFCNGGGGCFGLWSLFVSEDGVVQPLIAYDTVEEEGDEPVGRRRRDEEMRVGGLGFGDFGIFYY